MSEASTSPATKAVTEDSVGPRIQMLRKRYGLSMRQLAAKAGLTPGIVSCIERGKNSPSISTLSKILAALDSDLQTFFSVEGKTETGYVMRRENMRAISDETRSYALLFPKREDIKLEMLDEMHEPGGPKPELEALSCDVAGYIVRGSIQLEIQDDGTFTLRPGAAFYVPRDIIHRGFAVGEESARLISVCYPPKY